MKPPWPSHPLSTQFPKPSMEDEKWIFSIGNKLLECPDQMSKDMVMANYIYYQRCLQVCKFGTKVKIDKLAKDCAFCIIKWTALTWRV